MVLTQAEEAVIHHEDPKKDYNVQINAFKPNKNTIFICSQDAP
jgi:hypothetical protein